MHNILSEAVDSLCDTLRDDLSEPVIYEGDGDKVELQAVPSKPEELVDVSTGEVRISHDDLDWMFCARDLILAGQIARPKPGHRIVRLHHRPDESEVYEVLPQGNEQCWQRQDSQGRIILVHTKKVKA